MKLGILGTGAIVQDFLAHVKEMSGIEVAALCSTERGIKRCKELCEKYGIPAAYADPDALLSDQNVEVAYVAVPNHLHYEMVKKALDKGKHAICEKPFTSTAGELEELSALAGKRNLMIVEAVTTRYLPNALKIRDTLGQLGRIRIVSLNFSQYSSRYDAFRRGEILPAFNPKMSGGALMDLNIYNINLVVMLFGRPEKVDYQANVERGIDTSGVLTLDYGDFKCVCIAAKDCQAPFTGTIQGEDGCILITSAVNSLSGYKVLMNKAAAGRLMDGADGASLDYHNGKFRMTWEFEAIEAMIREKDYEAMEHMLDLSQITMDIQTQAREKAGIVFPADNKYRKRL